MPDKKIPVATANLDVSVQYKDMPLNNCTVELFTKDGMMDTGVIELGDTARKSIIVNQTKTEVLIRLKRRPKAPQNDTSQFPALGGDYVLGSIEGNTRVILLVAEPR
jgi:hypothetical protein